MKTKLQIAKISNSCQPAQADWLKWVLHHFQHYFCHITKTAHILKLSSKSIAQVSLIQTPKTLSHNMINLCHLHNDIQCLPDTHWNLSQTGERWYMQPTLSNSPNSNSWTWLDKFAATEIKKSEDYIIEIYFTTQSNDIDETTAQTSCVYQTLMPPQQPFFRKLWPWYLILNLAPTERSCHKVYSCEIWRP